MRTMWPTVLCFNKLPSIVVVVIISSCLEFAQQQEQPDAGESVLGNKNWLKPGQDLVFVTTTDATAEKPPSKSVIYVNNQPMLPTLVPFIPSATAATPEFLDCFNKCRTTAEFNPVCASNREVYGNEQRFNCATRCGLALAFLLLVIGGIIAVPHVNRTWVYGRPNIAAVQAAKAVYHPPAAYQNYYPSNITQWQHRNRTQYNQPGYRPAAAIPHQPGYGQNVFNRTRPHWHQPHAANRTKYGWRV